ncbi:MAG: TIR domain-containing protein [Bacteroidaceae bacterium]|nr:TIR domain-containing protein [Bacteroidaceae bacterium]
MKKLFIEDVYCDSGVPKYTYIEPNEHVKTKVALRSKGRGVIVEGPSGIGKTTCIKKIIADNNMSAEFLSARIQADIEYIKLILSSPRNCGIVIIDDFHLLSDEIKHGFSDLLKVLADESSEDTKLVLIGINKAGECLVQLAPDLNNRIDTIRFEANPTEKLIELISKGEDALNIRIEKKKELAERAFGSFHVIQMLCKALCIINSITETQETCTSIKTLPDDAISNKMQELGRVFNSTIKEFAVGNRNRRGGLAPYLRILEWLAESSNGAIQMDDIYILHPKYKASISQIADKGYITRLIQNNERISKVLYYDVASKILAIEDPKFLFYIKNTNWALFEKEMGFKISEHTQYDFAMSFAGEKRKYVEMLVNKLVASEVSVFYDKNAAVDILGQDLDKYFAPIYAADAKYVVAMIDSNYPMKVWTVFESQNYKERFGENSVIPILFEDFTPSPMDILYNKGYERIDTTKEVEPQIERIATLLIKKLEH